MALSDFPSRAFLLGALIFTGALSVFGAEAWENTLSPYAPGTFPEMRPMHAHYNFGWNAIVAAEADFRFSKTADGKQQLDATGHTVALVRKLWSFDIVHTALTDGRTLRPIQVRETEERKTKKFVTEMNFTQQGVVSRRDEFRGSAVKSKTRGFEMATLHSIDSALLYLRTQSLKPDAVQRIVVYPGTTAYLCTVTPLGHEQITNPTGSYNAIKLDLQLQKIDKNRQLAPHRKFRRATIWLSDDPNRMVLRIEAQIFAGAVFAELQSFQFDDGKP